MPSAPQLDATGRPLRDLRISVTDRCNFRCGYCMPGDVYGEKYRFLPRTEILSFEEIERLARLFASLGATKLRVTGGEPLIRHALPALIERLAAIEEVEDLALTTNGYLLADLAQPLKDAGDFVAGKVIGHEVDVTRSIEALGIDGNDGAADENGVDALGFEMGGDKLPEFIFAAGRPVGRRGRAASS